MHTLESEHAASTELDRVTRRFFPQQSVMFFAQLWTVKRETEKPGFYVIEQTMPNRRCIAHESELEAVAAREAPEARWEDFTPVQRSVLFPGFCCECRAAVPFYKLRCEEHESTYQQARAA